eukprot:TRINITY_DN23126_c0_g1_i1.p1 TRINITY_DN23126_c0_g1~~TRINITY_DN23126_c0_g1_i1.p1  ORF type:complete len:112 (-),score=6.42 TRINITY_DN23126_c0_g1_i1:439-774(-)
MKCDAVRVAVRIRPLMPMEKVQRQEECTAVVPGTAQVPMLHMFLACHRGLFDNCICIISGSTRGRPTAGLQCALFCSVRLCHACCWCCCHPSMHAQDFSALMQRCTGTLCR